MTFHNSLQNFYGSYDNRVPLFQTHHHRNLGETYNQDLITQLNNQIKSLQHEIEKIAIIQGVSESKLTYDPGIEAHNESINFLKNKISHVTKFLTNLQKNPNKIYNQIKLNVMLCEENYDFNFPSQQSFAIRLVFPVIKQKLAKIEEVFGDRDTIDYFLRSMRLSLPSQNNSHYQTRLDQIKLFFMSRLLYNTINWLSAPHIGEFYQTFLAVVNSMHIPEEGNLPNQFALKVEEKQPDSAVDVRIDVDPKASPLHVSINVYENISLYDNFEAKFPTPLSLSSNEDALRAYEKDAFKGAVTNLQLIPSSVDLVTELEKIIADDKKDIKFCTIITNLVARILELKNCIRSDAEEDALNTAINMLKKHLDIMPGAASRSKTLMGILFGIGTLISIPFTLSAYNLDIFTANIAANTQNKIATTITTTSLASISATLFYSARCKGVAKEVENIIEDKNEKPNADELTQPINYYEYGN